MNLFKICLILCLLAPGPSSAILTDNDTFYSANTGNIILDIYKGSYGYDVIKAISGEILVYNSRIEFLYLGPGNKWKPAAIPTSISYEDVTGSYNIATYNIARHYSGIQADADVYYHVQENKPIKTIYKLYPKVADDFRVTWALAGIANKDPLLFHDQSFVIGDNILSVDISDIVFQLGPQAISYDQSTQANGLKVDYSFNLGSLQKNQNITIDPWIDGVWYEQITGIVSGEDPCSGTCTPYVYDLEGATVSVGPISAYTNSSGLYVLNIPNETFNDPAYCNAANHTCNVSFTKSPEFYSEISYDVEIGFYSTTLERKPTGTITGSVFAPCTGASIITWNESATHGIYQLNITSNVTKSGRCGFGFSIDNETYLSADTIAPFNESENWNTTSSDAAIFNVADYSFHIRQGQIWAGTKVYYNYSRFYNTNTSLSISDQIVPLRSNVTVLFDVVDPDHNDLNISGSLYQNGGYIPPSVYGQSPHDFSNLSSGEYTYNIGVIEYATTGLNVYNIDNIKIIKAAYNGAKIAIFDTVQGDTEFSFFSPSGSHEAAIISNGEEYNILQGSHIVQVMPVDPGYRADPVKLGYILLMFLSVLLIIIILLALSLALVNNTKYGVRW